MMTSHVEMSPIASTGCSASGYHASGIRPIERTRNQLGEDQVHADRGEQRERDRQLQARAERGRGRQHDERRRDDEAEPVRAST